MATFALIFRGRVFRGPLASSLTLSPSALLRSTPSACALIHHQTRYYSNDRNSSPSPSLSLSSWSSSSSSSSSPSPSLSSFSLSLALVFSVFSLSLGVMLTGTKTEAKSEEEEKQADLPVYTRSEIEKHNNRDSAWVTFKGDVYDITKFIQNHPGGVEKILLAAGRDVASFWSLYRQHYNSPLPMQLLNTMKIGTLHPDDKKKEAEAEAATASADNPYSSDPRLSPVLSYLSREPINAESPASLLSDSWITPTELFFVRNHHPVPNINPDQHALKITIQTPTTPSSSSSSSLSSSSSSPVDPLLSYKPVVTIPFRSLESCYNELVALEGDGEGDKSHTVVTSIQCGGNRRQEMTKLEKTNGASWQAAISTASFSGLPFTDLLSSVLTKSYLDQIGCHEQKKTALPLALNNNSNSSPAPTSSSSSSSSSSPLLPPCELLNRLLSCGYRHVHAVGADGMEASIPLTKALNERAQVLLAMKMNGETLPRQHGYPLRFVAPGHAGVRNVKWVNEIRVSTEEAYGTWQRGMAYKGFGPSRRSLEGVDVSAIPSLQEQPVQSCILSPSPSSSLVVDSTADGDAVLSVSGFAYSGGGRGIVRVDVSVDGGKTWQDAEFVEGAGEQQEDGRAFAWTLWQADCKIKLKPQSTETVNIVCKATDTSYNVQPDSVAGIWNLRGINNNAWHRVQLKVKQQEPE